MKPFPHRSNGQSVGRGVVSAILAAAQRDEGETPEAWVHFCVTAADEAYLAVLEAGPSERAKPQRGSAAKLLYKLSDPEDQRRMDTEDALEAGQSEVTKAEAHEAAATAFKLCMPKIAGRRRAQAYLACVAVGVQRRYITGAEAKSLLYTAQLALSAYPSRRAKPGQK